MNNPNIRYLFLYLFAGGVGGGATMYAFFAAHNWWVALLLDTIVAIIIVLVSQRRNSTLHVARSMLQTDFTQPVAWEPWMRDVLARAAADQNISLNDFLYTVLRREARSWWRAYRDAEAGDESEDEDEEDAT